MHYKSSYLRNKAHVFLFVAEKPLRWRNVVWNRQAMVLAESWLLYFKQHFDSEEFLLQQIQKTMLYFIQPIWQQNEADHFCLKKNEIGWYVMSFLYKTVEKAVITKNLQLHKFLTIKMIKRRLQQVFLN